MSFRLALLLILIPGCFHKTYYQVPPACLNRPVVIVYGTAWCQPCHAATEHLEEKGVCFTGKNVELDEDARDELKAKLMKAGLKYGTFPILDVDGELLVGYGQDVTDAALRKHGML